MTQLNPRTRIECRWTTNPADLGYDGKKSNWREGPADLVGTPKTIIEKWAERARRCGLDSGTYYAVEFRANGITLNLDDIRHYNDLRDYERQNRR